MGFHFSLQDANIVAYLTDRGARSVPRIKSFQLWQFLGGLNELRESRRPSDPPRGFISSRNKWAQQFDLAAAEAFRKINRLPWNQTEFFDPRTVNTLLAPIRVLLSQYSLFGLTIRGPSGDEALDSFARHAAFSSDHHALFLITHQERTDQSFEWLDPFPALRPLSEDPAQRPGMLFWTPDGTSAYAPLKNAQLIYAKVLMALEAGKEEDIVQILTEHRRPNNTKRILHLSDLHLGTDTAAENQELLLQNLQRVIPTVDRIVITGDLFDEPKRSYSVHFRNFQLALRRFSNKAPIVVPGNHDQKRFGNVSGDLREVADLEWEKLVVDDDMGTTFFCFDSSKDADLARGKVTQTQKRDVAVEYEARLNHDEKIDDYLKIALIHHHPFSFQADEQSILNRGLSLFGKSDEDFLKMEDGDEFANWCARRCVPLILHGHKHVPRHVVSQIELKLPSGTSHWRPITAIGCGSSLGAEGKPLSYNIVSWDPKAKLWGATFFADPGDGGGFANQKIVTSHQ